MSIRTGASRPYELHVNLLAEYVITMPNMYARGILFGKMVLELGDTCTAKNEKNGLTCDLEFKTKVLYSLGISTSLLISCRAFSRAPIMLWQEPSAREVPRSAISPASGVV